MIGIHIYGVPTRLDMIRTNADKLQLPPDHIHIDDRFGQNHGCYPSLYSCRLAWLAPIDPRETHRLCIQDDVELCDDFESIIKKIVKAHPKEIISLFPYDFQKRDERLEGLKTPYIRCKSISGQAIILPVSFISKWDAWVRANHSKGDIPDDTSIRMAAEAHGVKWLTTIPAIVQHIGDESLLNGVLGVRRTEYYDKNPQADWSCKTVAPMP